MSYGTAAGTATSGTDFTAKSGTLTFTSAAAGSQTFSVQTTEDDVDEGTGETFTVSISSPSGGGGPAPSLATSASVTTTISDDDDASGITLSAAPSSLGEDDGETSVTVTATLAGATLPESTTVTIGTLSGGATKGTDYTATTLSTITIPATSSSGTGTLKITPTDDQVVEGDETITIPGSTSTEVGLSVTSATVTLTDDDKTTTGTPDDKDSAVLSISGPSAAVAEGSDAEFTVTLSKSVAAEVQVAWSAPLSTDAAAGADLSATSGTVTFAANSSAGATQTITITATDDKLSETSEGFTVTLGTITSTLSSQVGLKNGASSATATISASDPITINITGPSSVDEGDATTNYTVSLSPSGVTPTADLTVSYGTADGTAVAGTDFTAKSGTLTFTQTAAGSQTFTVQTTEDNVDEGTGETFTVSISSPSGGGGPTPSLDTSATVTTTITDDDDASGITLSAVPLSLGEDDGETSVTVTATLAGGVLPGSTTVTIGTLSGSATKDTDYSVGTSLASITIPANTASGTGTMKITPTDDAVVEGDETITIPGSTSTEVGLSVASATVTLTDDDKTTTGTPDDKDSAVLSISGPSAAVAEGSEASFTVTLSKSVAAEVSVGWSAPLGTDAAAGSDLSATSGTVTFAANSAAGATRTITITATDDKLSETAETFTVTLGTITSTLSSQLSLASSAKAAAATIAASDPITVNISGPSSVDEGDATTSYTVSLSPTGVTPTGDLTVSYGTAAGTATSGTDYTAKSGTLTFTSTAAGSQTFSVQTTEDDVDEGTGETFTVSISSPSGGGGPTPSLATSASVTTTISDDDDASGITLTAVPSSLGEDDGETTVTVTATLAGATLPGSTTVTIGTLSGGATKGTDYTSTTLSTITIPATSSSGTGTLKITPTDDAVVEGDESITIPGSTSNEVGLSVTSATVTLTDDDKTTTGTPDDKDSAVLSISGPASAVAEGSDAEFTVTLSKSVAAQVEVAWSAPLDADAAVGSDLSATSGTVTFAASSAAGATQTITITATDDKLSETAEGFTVTLGTITSTLSSQVGLKNGASSATATISASDPITVNISGPSSVDEGDATTNYTVSLSPSGVIPTADLTVSYGTANGTATAGTDFTAKSGTLTFTSTAAGSQTFSVQTTEDDVDEGTGETFTVSISSPSGGGGPAPSLNTSATVTTTITDDDDASGITLSANPSSLGEDDGETSVTVTATLAGGTLPGSTTVTIGTLSGGATKGTDYSVGTALASITIPANTASGTGTMKITPTDDAVVEGDESITIPGSTSTEVGLSVTSATVTLTDDDKTTPETPDDKDSAVLSISGPTSAVAEGSDASFTVTLSAAIAAKVDVAWSAPLSTDAAEGSDLSATSGTVTFAAGSAAGATQTITITATDDKLSETAEGFTVTLGTITSTLSEVSLKSGASLATATILASDPITVNISGPSSVDEGDATTNYTVSLSPSGVTPTSDLTVNYATANGTATAGTDYTAKSGTLTFTSTAAGSQTFKVQTTEDNVDEGTGETFTVSISSPSGGGGPAPSLNTSATVTTTITDDDDAPSGIALSADPSSLSEKDGETSVTVTATLNGSTLPGSTTVTIGTLSGSATKDTDYSVGTSLASITIPANTASGTGTMKITPIDDSVVEGDESITISGSTSTAVGLSVSDATITLEDRETNLKRDSAVLSISGPSSAVAEGSDASFTVTLSKSVAAEVKVAWSAPLGTDSAEGADLSATSGTVTFAANSSAGATKTITITATDDKLSETSEGFTVTLGTITSTLSSQISLKSGASSATATISASDPITINISGPSSVDEGDATTNYTVSLSPAGVTPTADLTVSYGTANGTATAGTDYTAKAGTLTFTQTAAGSQTFKVQTTEDNVDEGTGETFTVSVSNPSGGGGPTPSLNTSATVTTTITDDDDASGITLSASPSSLGEDDGETSVTVTATLNGSTLPGATVVTIGTLSGGATKDTDYTVGTALASITIPANTASGTGTMKITPTDDAVVEGDETITIPGSTSAAVGLSVASATVTLTDDDKSTTETPDDKDSAVLSISGPTSAVAEGSDAEFVVTLSKSVAAEVSVGWSAPLGTDAAEGSDLSATSGTVTFAANSAAGVTKTITITATDDRLSETAEGFTVTLGTITSTLSSQMSLMNGGASATATISPSDPITIRLAGSTSVTEGDSSSYTITLIPHGVIPTADLFVDYSTADGTASAGEDYVAKSGTLTFTRTNAAAQTVTVTTIADGIDEGNETFSLTITNPRGGGGPPPTVNTTVTTTIGERPDPTDPVTPTPPSETVPEVADEDPTPDYTPTFDACVNAASEPWGFVDVPAEHPNADDIHCIAYYGITIGTGDGITYSPSGFVPRWQVAKFLTRMARRVGIEVPATPPDTAFTDIGHLSYGTQATIKQLADLGIVRGTTPTTYSPHDVVTRGQMALFIARLMNRMTPLTDGDPAMDDTTFYGYTPSLVAENEEVKVRDDQGLDVAPAIKSPYTDMGSIGNDMDSAITQLYELGVVTGLTPTTFGSSDPITRASTAEFIAGALAHSSVRPAGLSIQADNTADYGEYVATMLISVRDDEFGPVADGLVDIFQNNCADICGEDAHFITSGAMAGRCNGRQTVGDCIWDTGDHKTDRNGNILFGARIGATPEIEGTTSRTHTVYAWIGSEPGDVFDLDDDDYVSAAASWIPVRDSVAVTTSISSDSADGMDRTTTGAPTDSGKLVHLGSTRSVVVTGQLTDSGGSAVKQGGVGIRVSWTRYVFDRGPDGADAGDSFVITYENTDEATRTTTDDGKATFAVRAPRDVESDTDQDVVDLVTFTVDADGKTDGTANTVGSVTFNWVEDTPVYQKTAISATEHVLVDGDGDDADISVSARLLDQYGEGIRVDDNGNAYRITLALDGNGSEHFTDIDADTPGVQATSDVVKTPSIRSGSSSRGMARASFSVNDIARTTHSLDIAYRIAQAQVDSEGLLVDGDPHTDGVQIIYQSLTGATASGTTAPTNVYVAATDGDGDDRKITVHQTFGGNLAEEITATHFATEGSGTDHGVLYAMDDNDTYINNGERTQPCVAFRPQVGDVVRVVVYSIDGDGASIYDIAPHRQLGVIPL